MTNAKSKELFLEKIVSDTLTKDKIENIGTRLKKIVYELEKSYNNNQIINPVDFRCNPTQDIIEIIIKDLFKVIFPGFISVEAFTDQPLSFYITAILRNLYRNLEEQLTKAYINAYFKDNQGVGIKEFTEPSLIAKKITIEIVEAIPEIISCISQDVEASYRGDPAALSYTEIILSYPFVKAITVHRIAHILYNKHVPMIPRMMSEWAHTQTGIDIHPGARIGRSFFIDHGTGVVIGETTEVGNNVKIYQGVTLGALSFEKNEQGDIIKGKKRHPTLKDNVIVYANATVLGGNTVIGKNCIIGGNTWITSSVEEDTIVTLDSPKLRFRRRK